MSVWIVTGQTESGDEWEFQLKGEEPSIERINYIYATLYPEEWEYMPEIYPDTILADSDSAWESEGPTLKQGYSLKGDLI